MTTNEKKILNIYNGLLQSNLLDNVVLSENILSDHFYVHFEKNFKICIFISEFHKEWCLISYYFNDHIIKKSNEEIIPIIHLDALIDEINKFSFWISKYVKENFVESEINIREEIFDMFGEIEESKEIIAY